jgi:NADP-dependent 3-hydroxy acid dehydrogenase YdfG
VQPAVKSKFLNKEKKRTEMSNITDKVVVITGASSGIGESTAKLLAERGAKVVLGARRSKRIDAVVQEISATGGKAIGFATDVTKRAEVEALIQSDCFGRVDVLVNNAGIMPIAPIEALKVDEWDRQIDVNIKGLLYGVAAALPHMQKQKSGHIINMASVFGIKMFAPGGTVYCATKAAVRALTEGLRMELHSQNIRCTMISPGAIATELSESSSDEATRKNLREFMKMAIPASAIARAIAYAIEQPVEVETMRWSSAQPYRISKAEVNYAPFLLVPWAPILAGLSSGLDRGTGAYGQKTLGRASPSEAGGPLWELISEWTKDSGPVIKTLAARGARI